MPEVRLDAGDAAELAEMLQFLTGWLARDPPAWPPPWRSSPVTPPMASASCARTWTGLSSCSAAATASSCSAAHRTKPHARERSPGRSSLVLPRFAQRKLARQTGYKLRDDQQNRSRAQSAIVPYVHLGHADLRHPRGLHGSQHAGHGSGSNFIARAIPSEQPARHRPARQPWQPASAVVRCGGLAWLPRPPGASLPRAA
jgi:hypothetical protein